MPTAGTISSQQRRLDLQRLKTPVTRRPAAPKKTPPVLLRPECRVKSLLVCHDLCVHDGPQAETGSNTKNLWSRSNKPLLLKQAVGDGDADGDADGPGFVALWSY